ncbi:hypothetical protein SAY86_024256 [Trapa natans]|uniref:X8 domain-containing protein n=1 Tax=Trapa natans TaxID=22666 RepID=A0AAN7MPM1_TRANT|nr:hypothetical protein SAY86_024256 [Trapa natans]
MGVKLEVGPTLATKTAVVEMLIKLHMACDHATAQFTVVSVSSKQRITVTLHILSIVPSISPLMAGNFRFFLPLLGIMSSLLAGGSGEAVSRSQDGVVNPELCPIQSGGACYFPSDVLTMASYAFNNYYLTHGLTDSSCFFGNTAALTSLNPSKGSCKFQSSSSVNNGAASASPLTTGQGPAYGDLNGCSEITKQWFTFLFITHFFFLVLLVTR